MEEVATLMSMELSGMVSSLTDPAINILRSSEIRKIIVCWWKKNYLNSDSFQQACGLPCMYKQSLT